MQADGVAVAQAKWRARRAGPSARALSASRADTWGGGQGAVASLKPGARDGARAPPRAPGGCRAPGASTRGRAGLRSHSSSASVRVPIPIPSHTRGKAVKRTRHLPPRALIRVRRPGSHRVRCAPFERHTPGHGARCGAISMYRRPSRLNMRAKCSVTLPFARHDKICRRQRPRRTPDSQSHPGSAWLPARHHLQAGPGTVPPRAATGG